MTNNFPVKPCPSCGSKNRVDTAPHKVVWCAECGAISCPHCGSTRVIEGQAHWWERRRLSCQICGFGVEAPEAAWKPMTYERRVAHAA